MRRLAVFLTLSLLPAEAQKFHADDPLEYELPPVAVKEAGRRKLSDYYDAVRQTLFTAGDLNRNRKTPVAAQAVNTLGEPLQGAWWQKRHYYQRLSREQLIAGPGSERPPSTNGPWTVIGAKNEGITPGFVMLDARQELYFIKFDPMSNPEMATGADHVALRLVHALGYHVPENYVITFPEELLVIGKDVTIADRIGRRRRMTRGDLADMLRKAPRAGNGHYRATASRAISGKGIGPYRYHGRRSDDANDFVPHEHRRDLRGLSVVSAWIGHDDSRAINTYDALVEENGRSFVRHYILDLGSTLGSGTQKANSARSGGEYLFGWKQSAVQLFSLGLAVPAWAKAHFPQYPSVGRFEYERFDPETWVPEYPNPAFLNKLPDDEFWAAKQIAAFRDEEIQAIVDSAVYSDPKAAQWIVECLVQRRNKIARAYFGKVLPIDRFRIDDGRLVFDDLAEQAGMEAGGPYIIEWHTLDNATGTRTAVAEGQTATVPRGSGLYLQARIRSTSRPGTQTVDVALRSEGGGSPCIVGVERRW